MKTWIKAMWWSCSLCKQGMGIEDLPGCEEWIESLQVRTKEQANMLVFEYSGPPGQEEVKEALCWHLLEASESQAVVLKGNRHLLGRQRSQAHTAQELPEEHQW